MSAGFARATLITSAIRIDLLSYYMRMRQCENLSLEPQTYLCSGIRSLCLS